MNGYERIRGETILDWPGFEPVVPPVPEASAEVEVGLPEGKGELPGVEVRARLPSRHMGECVTVSCGEYASAREAQRWTEVYGLGVAEQYQGEGWGRYLLMRALSEARKVGYEHAVISTWLGNHRALLFYSNYGFRVVDWTYGHGREL
jgi:GNAT superfamily N-acetyltransferase